MRQELLSTITNVNRTVRELYPNLQCLIKKRPVLLYFEQKITQDQTLHSVLYCSSQFQQQIQESIISITGVGMNDTDEEVDFHDLIHFTSGEKKCEVQFTSLEEELVTSHRFGDVHAPFALIVLSREELEIDSNKDKVKLIQAKHPRAVLIIINAQGDELTSEFKRLLGPNNVIEITEKGKKITQLIKLFLHQLSQEKWQAIYEYEYVKSQTNSFNDLLAIIQLDIEKEKRELEIKLKDAGTDRSELTLLMRSSAYTQIRKESTDILKEEISKFRTNFMHDLEEKFDLKDGELVYGLSEKIGTINYDDCIKETREGSKINFTSSEKIFQELHAEIDSTVTVEFDKTMKELEEVHTHVEDGLTEILNQHELSAVSLDPVRSKIHDHLRSLEPVAQLRNKYSSSTKYKGNFKDYFNAARSGIMIIMGIMMVSSMTSGNRLDPFNMTQELKPEDVMTTADISIMSDAESYQVIRNKKKIEELYIVNKDSLVEQIPHSSFKEIEEHLGYNDVVEELNEARSAGKENKVSQLEEKRDKIKSEAKLLQTKIIVAEELKKSYAEAVDSQWWKGVFWQTIIYLLVIALLYSGVWDFKKQVREYREEFEEKEIKALTKILEDQCKSVIQKASSVMKKEVQAHLDELNIFVNQQVDRKIGQVETLNKELEVSGRELDLQMKIASQREQGLPAFQAFLIKDTNKKMLDLRLKLLNGPDLTAGTGTTNRTSNTQRNEAKSRYQRRNA